MIVLYNTLYVFLLMGFSHFFSNDANFNGSELHSPEEYEELALNTPFSGNNDLTASLAIMSCTTDTDGDGVIDADDIDDDNDGIVDIYEATSIPNPDKAWLFQGGLGEVYHIDLITSASTVYGQIGFKFNAVTFNEADGMLWGAKGESISKYLVIVDPSTLVATEFPNIELPQAVSGAFDPISKTIMIQNSSQNLIYVLDADPSSATYQTIINTISSTFDTQDFAYHIQDQLYYGIEVLTGNLISTDPVSGVQINLGPLPGTVDPNAQYGAAYSTQNGDLFFGNNDNGEIVKVFETSPGNWTAEIIAIGPSASANDGAKLISYSVYCDLGNGADLDEDGYSNHLDIDIDDDGITDNVEAQSTAAYIAPSGLDANGNGLDDAYEVAPGTPGFNDDGIGLLQVDTDGDNISDTADNDSDNDGISDTDEAGHGVNQASIDVSSDTDEDGLRDVVEGGDFDDGFEANDENLDPTNTNFLLDDTDDDTPADGSGAVPLDKDLDYRDNRIDVDTDGDGIIDAEDLDDDNDGIPDSIELAICPVPEVDKTTTSVTSEISWNNSLDKAIDGIEANNLYAQPNNQDISNTVYLKFQLATPMALNAIELSCVSQGLVDPGSEWQVEGSNDDVNWLNLSGIITTSGPQTGIVSGSTYAENLSFGNENPYTYYRIYGVSGETINWYLTEVYFQALLLVCDTDGDGISNHLDLDSDGDGCFDAAEAGHGEIYDTDGVLDGEFGENGLDNDLETSDSSTADINYTISSTNDPNYDFLDPDVAFCQNIVASNDINQTPVNVPVGGNVLTNDMDPSGGVLTVNVIPVTDPSSGSVVINPDGSYTYTPDPDFVGEDSFEYEVCDDGDPVSCDIATVTVQVIPLLTEDNNPLTVNDDTGVTPVDTPVSGNVTNNDNDPDGDNIIVNPIPIDGPENGTIVINPDGSYTYTPNPGFIGSESITIEVCDDGTPVMCEESELIIDVIPTNPENEVYAQDDAGLGTKDNPIDGDLIGNDSDPEGDNLMVNTTPVNGPDNGTLVIHPDGTYTFTPDPDFVGNDQFTYSVCDDGTPEVCDTATVYLTILDEANTIDANDDINNTFMDEEVEGNLLANDNDAQGDNLTVSVAPINEPDNGTVVINPDGTYTYTPNSGFVGEDSFQYEVCDDGTPAVCDTATVTIQIMPALVDGNNPPMVNDDSGVTPVDTPVSGNVTNNDGDPDGDNLIVNTSPIDGPDNGTIVINPDGSYTYTPDPGFVGEDTIIIEVCDEDVPALCEQSELIIEVIPDNPDNEVYAQDDAGLGEEGEPIEGDLIGNDSDPEGDNLTVNITPVDGTENGSVVINPDGTYTYMPVPGYTGNDQFTYEVCDNGSPVTCDTATVYLTVLASLNTTEANNDMATTDVDVSVCGSVLTNDNDPEGDEQTVNTTPVTDPVNGTVVLSEDGTYTYTPNPGFEGVDVFEYEVCDNGSPVACDVASVTISVGGPAIELTANFFIDGNTFAPTQSRDALFVIENIGTVTADQPVQFLITKAEGDFSMVVMPTTTTVDVFGGLIADNSDWEIVDLGSFYQCTLKTGKTIPSGTSSSIGLTISTSSGLISSTGQSTGQLVDFTAGDIQLINNFAQGIFIIN